MIEPKKELNITARQATNIFCALNSHASKMLIKYRECKEKLSKEPTCELRQYLNKSSLDEYRLAVEAFNDYSDISGSNIKLDIES